ncbi:MAG: helix-turn-helix domain-containing protein, partial [bacterium]|nr:helix-turn-helix domain-containing protein [bacterium]
MSVELRQIGKVINRLREEKRITQEDLARTLGTTQSAIARIENGEQNVTTEMLTKIGKALNREVVSLGTGSINLKIEGGHKLSGSITTKTSKNAAVALLCASLLNKNKTLLKNMPRIEEVYRIIEVLESIGVNVRWINNDIEIKPGKLSLGGIDYDSAIKTRSIILLIGPLVHELTRFNLPQAGGCRLGSRTVKPHFYALEKLGVDITAKSKHYAILRKKLGPADIVLYESGDTVTENVIMAAARIP